MKAQNFLCLYIIIIFVNYSSQRYLSLTTHQSNRFSSKNGAQDLIGKKVECPNGGVLKNFVLLKERGQYYYRFQCYSSNSGKLDEGEPILKGSTLHYTLHNSRSLSKSLETLDGVGYYCWVDYGLNSFEIVKDNGNKIKTTGYCKGIKTKSKKLNINTKQIKGTYDSLDNLVGIIVGPTNAENDADIAYVLREVKYKVSSSFFHLLTKKVTISYYYSYSIVKNMRTITNNYKSSFARLRNGNNQKI